MPRPSIGLSRPASRCTPLAHAAAVLVAIGCGACSTTERSEVDELRSRPPAPMIVFVDWEPVGGAVVHVAEEPFPTTKERMAALLAHELRALDACSRVVTAGSPATLEPDLRLTFQPTRIDCDHAGTASALAAGGLWLVTWIGGLLVEDSTYTVQMQAQCTYQVASGSSFTTPVNGDSVDLSFFERNDFFSGPTLQSLVLPPFWTSDDADKTSECLSREAVRIAARQIATLLKNDVEARGLPEWKCSVTVTQPANGEAVAGATAPIALEVRLADPEAKLVAVTASVNGEPEVALSYREEVGVGYRAYGTIAGLQPDRENLVRLVVRDQDSVHTRTLRLGGAR
jgi:hypothetical protein